MTTNNSTNNVAAAGSLTGTTLASGVVTSSLTTVGTIGTGTWQGTVVGATYGGTGVNNGSSTITLGGSITFSGAHTFTGTLTADTSVTFPTSGTLLNSTIANVMDPSTQSVYTSPLLVVTGGLQTTSGTAYAVYLGQTITSITPVHVAVWTITAGTGTQTAEIGIFSTPAAPNGSGQTLTKLVAGGTSTFLSNSTITKNNGAFSTPIAAGTHIWAVVRTALATTQPTLLALANDMNTGSVLSAASVSALTSISSFSGSTISQSLSAQCPNLIITLA